MGSYIVNSKFPSWFAKILPKGWSLSRLLSLECMTLVEEAWCSSEYRFAVISNQFLDRNKFHIVVESKILNGDDGTSDNVFGLSDADMKSRYVEFYDMCDVYKSEKIPASEDLTKLALQEIPGTPLTPGWYKTWDRSKISCHYWLLHINFGYFGLQTIGENMVYNQQCYMNRYGLVMFLSIVWLSVKWWQQLTSGRILPWKIFASWKKRTGRTWRRGSNRRRLLWRRKYSLN